MLNIYSKFSFLLLFPILQHLHFFRWSSEPWLFLASALVYQDFPYILPNSCRKPNLLFWYLVWLVLFVTNCLYKSPNTTRLLKCEGSSLELWKVNLEMTFFFSTQISCILILSKFFFIFNQLTHKWIFLKAILKFTLKLTLKQLLHVSVRSASSMSALFELAKVTVVKMVN